MTTSLALSRYLASLDDPWTAQARQEAQKRTLVRKTQELVILRILTLAEAGLCGIFLADRRPQLTNGYIHLLSFLALLRASLETNAGIVSLLGFVSHLTCLVAVLVDGPLYVAAVACWLGTLCSAVAWARSIA